MGTNGWAPWPPSCSLPSTATTWAHPTKLSSRCPSPWRGARSRRKLWPSGCASAARHATGKRPELRRFEPEVPDGPAVVVELDGHATLARQGQLDHPQELIARVRERDVGLEHAAAGRAELGVEAPARGQAELVAAHVLSVGRLGRFRRPRPLTPASAGGGSASAFFCSTAGRSTRSCAATRAALP